LASSRWLLLRAAGDSREGGGVRQWGRHVMRGTWGLALTGGRCADAADARVPAVGRRGSEKREARARVGQPRETRSGLSPDEQ
jgi:hypothetical protein